MESSPDKLGQLTRRSFLTASAAGTLAAAASLSQAKEPAKQARIAITFDLEMSRHYPKRGMLEWDYQKGNLDEATKKYSVEAARVAKEHGGLIHFFCVGRVLEQADVGWIQEIARAGHPIGNHTYDHVNVTATEPAKTQFRFQRAPWLTRNRSAADIIRENIRITSLAMQRRAGLEVNGFRTPGGFHKGLADRPDVQQMLLELGFRWISSKYPPHLYGKPNREPGEEVYQSIVAAQQQAQPFVYPSGLIEIPMSPISDVGAFRSTFWKLEYFLEATRRSVQWAIQKGGVYDFLAHPSCMVVEDPTFETVKLICNLVKQAGDKAEIVGLDEIAKHVPRD
ncbi:MAG: chitin deacetylase [Planctomycetaceae bacterium]|nr:chitin deacetylase [Planctomycetaceae bacterium]